MDKVISSIGELPAMPLVISSLMGLTADVNADLDKISHALMTDQSLTVRVLKLSNSSFYGRTKEVTTLKEAIILLGFRTLRSLVVAASTHGLYNRGGNKYHGQLWEHSLSAAVASRLIARTVGHTAQEEAFIAGLLHDIGKLVFLEKKAGEYHNLIERVEAQKGSFFEAEEELFGFNHTDIGLLLLHKWSFPKTLKNAIFEHHDPIDVDERPWPLSFIVNLGNHFAKTLGVGFGDRRVADLLELPSVSYLGLTREDLQKMEGFVAEQYAYERNVFQA